MCSFFTEDWQTAALYAYYFERYSYGNYQHGISIFAYSTHKITINGKSHNQDDDDYDCEYNKLTQFMIIDFVCLLSFNNLSTLCRPRHTKTHTQINWHSFLNHILAKRLQHSRLYLFAIAHPIIFVVVCSQ